MPGPYRSPFPVSNPSKVWDAIVDALQSDPTLKRAVKHWQIGRGTADDLAEPSDARMPLLRLAPATGQGQWLDEAAHQYAIPIAITLGISGTDGRVLWDFWDAVRAALFTGNAVLDDLYALGVIQKTISSPAAAATLWGDASGLVGTATLTIKMRVDS